MHHQHQPHRRHRRRRHRRVPGSGCLAVLLVVPSGVPPALIMRRTARYPEPDTPDDDGDDDDDEDDVDDARYGCTWFRV